MITLAKKLLTGSGTTKELEGNGYVEFVSSTPMTITPKYTNSGVTLRYSLDGITWIPIGSGVTTPSANIIYFIGRAAGTKSLYTASLSSNAWAFTGATNLECNGKLDRLIQNTLGGDSDILTIGNYCFAYIFNNVTSLIRVYDDFLPATTLATSCYQNMFQGCKGLTIAPELPATTLQPDCYQNMFLGCTGLTIEPALPATTLASSCYDRMFVNCTGLTTLPKLSTLALQPSCYYRMFYGCKKIKVSTALTGIYDTAYSIPITGTGTTATDALTEMFTATGGTFTGTPEINTTYYTENTPV